MKQCLKFLDTKALQYAAHLNPTPGQDLAPVADILPGRDSMELVRLFHTELIGVMKSNNDAFHGFKVLSANSDVLKSLRATEEVVVPMFAKSRHESGHLLSIRGSRLQHVCCALAFELSQDVGAHSSLAEVENALDSFYPCIELLGSRFPFYPTHLEGFCGDLASHVGIVVGGRVDFRRVSASIGNIGLVLLRDNVPVQIGYTNNCIGGPLNATVAAAKYGHSLGVKLCKGNLIVCSGLSPRVPASKGKFDLASPYGGAFCTLVE
jgi:2-keto-4-pentenoate hydratase